MKAGRAKIALIGAGNIGGAAAYLVAVKELGDVVLFDVVDDMPQGKALDLSHSAAVLNSSISIKGTNSYTDIKDADVCIVTAGLASKQGMSRDDLISTNAGIVNSVTENILKYSKNPILIVVSNPLDVMTYAAYKMSGFSSQRVIGMAGILDTARYRAFLASALDVSPKDLSLIHISEPTRPY